MSYKKYSFILINLFFPFLLFAADSTRLLEKAKWSIIQVKNLPDKREDCGFVETGGKLYLIGGRGIRPVEVFDPVKRDWIHLKSTPIEMHHFQPVVFKGKIFVIGGMAGQYPHEKPLENLYIYDPLKDEWTKGAEIPESRRRGSGGTVVYKNKIYFIAGIQDGHYDGTVNWFDCYDPVTEKWATLPDAPFARDHFTAVVIDNKLYSVGGRRTSGKTKQGAELTEAAIDVFDFKNNEWKTLPPLQNIPTQRAGCTAVNFKGKLVVIGGESVVQQLSHNEVEAFDPKTGKWQKMPSLVIGRHDTQAVVYKNKIYIADGSAKKGGGPDENTIEVFE